MKRIVMLSILGMLAFSVSLVNQVAGKAHVPSGKIQMCHKGKTITVSENALRGHQQHGDCQLPACDFNNVFHTGEPCPNEDRGDGKCVLPNARDSAEGVTDACPEGTF